MPEGVRKSGEKRRDSEAGASDAVSGFKEKSRLFRGTIKCFDEKRGYGFIKCPELFEKFQSDVFIHKKQFNGFCVGDSVNFHIQVNSRDQPQAVGLHDCDLMPPALADPPERRAARQGDGAGASGGAAVGGDGLRGPDPDGAASVFQGTVKLIDGVKGYGFIRCEESYALYGRDVFASHSLMSGLSFGDHVRFSVRVSRDGKPQATDLTACDPREPMQPQPRRFAGDGVDPCAGVEQREANVVVHQGTVKKIDSERGYGFVACQALYDTYGSDVFASHKQISGFAVGDHVSFVVRVNRRGQPQAADLAHCGSWGEEATADADPAQEEREAATMSGTIKSFDADHGYGFISSLEVHERYGRDVFLHSRQIRHFQPSDHVTFSVRISSQGQPQAYDLKAAPETVAWLAVGGEDDAPAPDGEEYVGEIKSFSTAHGYGFIECPSLHDVYGRDVFIHQSQYDGLGVGDRVSFRVQVKRGQPRACDVSALRAPYALSGAAGAEPPQTPAGRGDLDRQLLRACASARAESVDALRGLLAAGADPNARDVAGHTALMVSALNPRHGERKCRLLIENRADLSAKYHGSTSILQWARERINSQFAEYLEGLKQGKRIDYTVALDIPRDID